MLNRDDIYLAACSLRDATDRRNAILASVQEAEHKLKQLSQTLRSAEQEYTTATQRYDALLEESGRRRLGQERRRAVEAWLRAHNPNKTFTVADVVRDIKDNNSGAVGSTLNTLMRRGLLTCQVSPSREVLWLIADIQRVRDTA